MNQPPTEILASRRFVPIGLDRRFRILDIDILTICRSLRRLLRCFVVCSLFRTSNIVLRLRYLLVHTMPVPMNREAAMLLYGERRRRTAIVYLDREGGTYKRSDVLSMLEITVSLSMVEAIGQLQNNWTWEILFRDEATKDLAIAQDEVLVKQHRAVVADFHRQTKKLRVVRVLAYRTSSWQPSWKKSVQLWSTLRTRSTWRTVSCPTSESRRSNARASILFLILCDGASTD